MTTGNSMWDALMERQRATARPKTPAVVRASISLDPGILNKLDEMAGSSYRSAYMRKLVEAEYAKPKAERLKP